MTKYSLWPDDRFPEDNPANANLPGYGWYVAGGPSIRLKNKYHVDQYWLDFCHSFVFKAETHAYDHFSVGNLYTGILAVSPRRNQDLADQPFGASKNYSDLPMLTPPELDCPQFYIPFDEFRMIEGRDAVDYINAGFSTFDRNSEGELYEVNTGVYLEDHPELVDWCRDNFSGRFHVYNGWLTLENEEDYFIARLKF